VYISSECGNIKVSRGCAVGRSKINRGQLRREELREEAEVRREHRAGLSNAQQIERLNALLGDGVGAVRERERLSEKIEVKAEKKSKSKTSGSTRERDKRKSKKSRGRRSMANE
jgi:hypothetical protein